MLTGIGSGCQHGTVSTSSAETPPDLPARPGSTPEVTRPTPEDPHPHQQLSQNSPPAVQEALFERARGLPGVIVADSCVSVPGARAFHLEAAMARGPAEAFQCRTEFAHLHPPHDGSLHLTLPAGAYDEVRRKGWGEPHPISGTMMLFGPRDADELEVAWRVLLLSYRFAHGELGPHPREAGGPR